MKRQKKNLWINLFPVALLTESVTMKTKEAKWTFTLISQGVYLHTQIIETKRICIRQKLAKVVLEFCICNFYSEFGGNYKPCLCFWTR